jgi:rod shape-determining protein MreD
MFSQLFAYLCLSLLFTFLPVPSMLSSFWPNWIMLFFLWVNLYKPRLSIFAIIWVLGLFLDLLQATNLGVHVIALLITNFIIAPYRSKFLIYPVTQQMLVIFISTIVYVFFAQFFCIDMPLWRFISYLFGVSLATAFVWPWVDFVSKPKLSIVSKKISL